MACEVIRHGAGAGAAHARRAHRTGERGKDSALDHTHSRRSQRAQGFDSVVTTTLCARPLRVVQRDAVRSAVRRHASAPQERPREQWDDTRARSVVRVRAIVRAYCDIIHCMPFCAPRAQPFLRDTKALEEKQTTHLNSSLTLKRPSKS